MPDVRLSLMATVAVLGGSAAATAAITPAIDDPLRAPAPVNLVHRYQFETEIDGGRLAQLLQIIDLPGVSSSLAQGEPLIEAAYRRYRHSLETTFAAKTRELAEKLAIEELRIMPELDPNFDLGHLRPLQRDRILALRERRDAGESVLTDHSALADPKVFWDRFGPLDVQRHESLVSAEREWCHRFAEELASAAETTDAAALTRRLVNRVTVVGIARYGDLELRPRVIPLGVDLYDMLLTIELPADLPTSDPEPKPMREEAQLWLRDLALFRDSAAEPIGSRQLTLDSYDEMLAAATVERARNRGRYHQGLEGLPVDDQRVRAADARMVSGYRRVIEPTLTFGDAIGEELEKRWDARTARAWRSFKRSQLFRDGPHDTDAFQLATRLEAGLASDHPLRSHVNRFLEERDRAMAAWSLAQLDAITVTGILPNASTTDRTEEVLLLDAAFVERVRGALSEEELDAWMGTASESAHDARPVTGRIP